MAAFRRGELQVLVATTVIEVGVDVANATVMVIEDADRFGIAQLHQLRGRVGRGRDKSWCYLLAEAVTPDAARRLACPRGVERRLRAGGGRPRAAGRGHRARDPAEGEERPAARLPAPGQGARARGPPRGRGHRRRGPHLAAHPLLADEVHLFVAEEEEEFVLKG